MTDCFLPLKFFGSSVFGLGEIADLSSLEDKANLPIAVDDPA
jgi:hypothetical protein